MQDKINDVRHLEHEYQLPRRALDYLLLPSFATISTLTWAEPGERTKRRNAVNYCDYLSKKHGMTTLFDFVGQNRKMPQNDEDKTSRAYLAGKMREMGVPTAKDMKNKADAFEVFRLGCNFFRDHGEFVAAQRQQNKIPFSQLVLLPADSANPFLVPATHFIPQKVQKELKKFAETFVEIAGPDELAAVVPKNLHKNITHLTDMLGEKGMIMNLIQQEDDTLILCAQKMRIA